VAVYDVASNMSQALVASNVCQALLRPRRAAVANREEGVDQLAEQRAQGALGDHFAVGLVRQAGLDLQRRQLIPLLRVLHAFSTSVRK